jgi:hypothetical protein
MKHDDPYCVQSLLHSILAPSAFSQINLCVVPQSLTSIRPVRCSSPHKVLLGGGALPPSQGLDGRRKKTLERNHLLGRKINSRDFRVNGFARNPPIVSGRLVILNTDPPGLVPKRVLASNSRNVVLK